MTTFPPLVADLQIRWHSLHDLDRAQAVKSIHQSGVSLRALSSFLNCSPSLLTHLLQAIQASPEDCALARRGLMSTRALVRRTRTTGVRRTALHREEIAYGRELAAIQFSQAIERWLDKEEVTNADRAQVVALASTLPSWEVLTRDLPQDAVAATLQADGRRSWPAQPLLTDVGLIAQQAQRLACWVFQGIPDYQLRCRTFELADAELNRRPASAP
jgi:hypothetical protein